MENNFQIRKYSSYLIRLFFQRQQLAYHAICRTCCTIGATIPIKHLQHRTTEIPPLIRSKSELNITLNSHERSSK